MEYLEYFETKQMALWVCDSEIITMSHSAERWKMEERWYEGGAITLEKDGYKIIGKTSQYLDYPELPLEFMQSISDDVCRVLQTDSLSFPVRGDIVRIIK